ncbi:SGNH hydrolase [Coccomyxa subellipsoidea C-169]|uniref:SGNH hydrolase n=1 Tax=Coccomyxa subellipsoidea (strain C-169) TaxID=574566 RepID=I0YMZ1_COCSC|nr:SGNH hydrolase [Coccomyxa subellipsoidea C-169]EIE19760.1 SGNH hydrolase [Coccomyxa subellipsoidea C-169]|eukprot:XP_005644304.1 SGNH hydrolase [Coccomyxa subellipsoidea C-169]
MPSMLRSLAAPILILLTAALHLPAIRGAQQPSQLCSCSDLLWRPAPPHIPEVVNWHSKLLNELAEAEAQGGYDVLFYGDSITMRWRDDWPANDWGDKPLPPNTPGGTPTGIFNATFRSKYTAGIMGIGSDTTANLWWRVINGELPLTSPAKVAVILIGTNDLGAIETCLKDGGAELEAAAGTSSRMRHMVAYMRRNAPNMHVVIVGILPRGAWTLDDKWTWPNRMTAAINAVNTASQGLTIEDNMIHYVDCGEGMIFPSNNTVNGRILPDELHPNTEGYRKLAACLGPVVDDLVAWGPTRNNTVLRDIPDSYTSTCDGYTGVRTATLSYNANTRRQRPDR